LGNVRELVQFVERAVIISDGAGGAASLLGLKQSMLLFTMIKHGVSGRFDET
jgi:hypothetical protein